MVPRVTYIKLLATEPSPRQSTNLLGVVRGEDINYIVPYPSQLCLFIGQEIVSVEFRSGC